MARLVRRAALACLLFLAQLGVLTVLRAPVPLRRQLLPALVGALAGVAVFEVAARRWPARLRR